MSHHDILDANSRGTTVILCEHSNTERGFLSVFKEMLEKKLAAGMKVTISATDCDPLRIV
jgi:putative NIF3 family GTP cyclohydrolase 1 type 2